MRVSLRERIYRFMQGRNGVDQLARAELMAVLAVLVIAALTRPFVPVYTVLSLLSTVLIVHTYFRILSRNIPKRARENQWWCNYKYRLVVKKAGVKKRWNERGMYKYFKCPQCRQSVRVPSGHGRICITCPRCKGTFVRRTGRRRG